MCSMIVLFFAQACVRSSTLIVLVSGGWWGVWVPSYPTPRGLMSFWYLMMQHECMCAAQTNWDEFKSIASKLVFPLQQRGFVQSVSYAKSLWHNRIWAPLLLYNRGKQTSQPPESRPVWPVNLKTQRSDRQQMKFSVWLNPRKLMERSHTAAFVI